MNTRLKVQGMELDIDDAVVIHNIDLLWIDLFCKDNTSHRIKFKSKEEFKETLSDIDKIFSQEANCTHIWLPSSPTKQIHYGKRQCVQCGRKEVLRVGGWRLSI